MKKLWVMLALLPVLAAASAEDKSAALTFLVVRDYNGKPVRNASVVLHPVNKDGKQSKGGLQLKTDGEGKTNFDGVPYGKLRIQVLAPGFQTFGEDYDVNQPFMEIIIKLKRPQQQFSIYEEHPNQKKGEPKKDGRTEKKDADQKPQ